MMTTKNKFKVLKEKMSDDSGAISTVEMIIIIAMVVTIATLVFNTLIKPAVTKRGEALKTEIEATK